MTLTPQRARPRLAAILEQTRDLQRDVPRALTTIHERLNNLDGYGGGTSEVSVQTSGSSSAVERTVLKRYSGDCDDPREKRLVDDLEEIDDTLRALVANIGDVFTLIRRYAPQLSTEEKASMRCAASPNLPGYHEPLDQGGWHDPACTDYAEPGRGTGLCIRCRGRRERWQRRQENVA